MRRAQWLGGLVAMSALCAPVAAQTVTGDATVRVPVAEVRGGKSTIYPVTGSLRQGMPVRIVREEDGWLAVTPPTWSSSWIQDRHVKYYPARNGQRAYLIVLSDNVPVQLGTPESAKPVEILTANLQRGAIAFPIGAKVTYKQSEWWRIEPAPLEVRYVSRDSVSASNSTVVAASPNPTPAATANLSNHPLWVKAEEAERAGNYAQAELCYRQLASDMAGPGGNHDLAIRCQNRIEMLWRSGRTGNWTAGQPAPGTLAANRPASNAPAPLNSAQSPTVASGPGILRRSAVVIDAKTAYVVEDSQGQLKYYLVAQPGLNLDLFLNRTVEVFGPFVPRNEMAGSGYISVGRLHLLR